jgi:ribosomal protein L17
VIESLATDEHLDWEQLLEALTDDIESRLEDALAELQDENVVRYSGRHGGYTLTDQ